MTLTRCLHNLASPISFSHPFLGSSETFNIDVLVSLLRQENAVDICVIKVPDHIKYADYFVVVSGVSPRHLRAMAMYAIKVVTKLYSFFTKCYYIKCVCASKAYTEFVFVFCSSTSF